MTTLTVISSGLRSPSSTRTLADQLARATGQEVTNFGDLLRSLGQA